MKRLWKQKIRQFWYGWGCPLLIAALVATSFKSAIADWNVVPTGSMNPTIVEGDRIFVNKLAYDLKIPYTTHHLAKWQNPERGDIVVFFSPADGQRLVKRIIGLPSGKSRSWIRCMRPPWVSLLLARRGARDGKSCRRVLRGSSYHRSHAAFRK